MRASLIEIEKIEAFLLGRMLPEEQVLTSAYMILDTDLRKKVSLQKVIYDTALTFGRQLLMQKIQKAEKALFDDPSNLSFQKEISTIFKS